MKNKIIVLLFSVVLFFVSCVNNSEPGVKTRLGGTWHCVENLTIPPYHRTYLVEINPLISDSTQYIISNFYASGENEFVYSKFTGSTLKITDNQSIGLSQKIFRSGSGVVSADYNYIKLNYLVFDDLTEVQVSAEYTR
ncbi:MAG: hypothetical protein PHS59_13755 [Paludibacter sp.]|nr:hypothetical protein [Paludibacter sp.]